MTALGIFTLFHVLLSLIGIGAGFIVLYGWLTSKSYPRCTSLFLITTIATSATGFLFPFHHFMPSYVIGILSLIILAISVAALYSFHLAGGWRRCYAITAAFAQYLNVFVLVAQLFKKVPPLTALAPTGSEPPFLIAQVIVMIAYIALCIPAVSRFCKIPAVTVETLKKSATA
jgi:hypothetical protein